MKTGWLLISILLGFLQVTVAQAEDHSMNNQTSYQIIKISNDPSARSPLIWSNNHYLLNINVLGSMIQKDSESGNRLIAYIAKLSNQGKNSIILRSSISRDDTVYYSKYWTKKESLLRITQFKALGSESDLNEFLGPFASIPTIRYGAATYELNFGGEKIQLTGPAFKKFWSLRKVYWSSSQVYLPLENGDAEKIAILELRVPISYMNHLDYYGLYAVIPNTF
jgi:hypothetical protein